MTELTIQQEKVSYALGYISYCQPALNHYFVKNYAEKWGVIEFAKFFYGYWERLGKIIFSQNNSLESDEYHENFIKLVDEKYQEWLKIMDYDKYKNLA